MVEIIKKVVKTGYGLGLLSLAEAKKIARELKKRLNLSEEESLKLARELVANSEKASQEVLAAAGKYFEAALIKSGAASKGELKTAKKFLRKRAHRIKSTMKEKVRKGLHRFDKKR